MKKATLFADGGSRGNPGPAASGAVLYRDDASEAIEIGEFLGIATNNVAEWTALAIGLRAAREHGIDEISIRLDSELVVRQVSGVYRVKHADLIPLHAKVKALLREFAHYDIAHVPRIQNKAADAVVNAILDGATSSQSASRRGPR